jgi:hypothetical protein
MKTGFSPRGIVGVAIRITYSQLTRCYGKLSGALFFEQVNPTQMQNGGAGRLRRFA